MLIPLNRRIGVWVEPPTPVTYAVPAASLALTPVAPTTNPQMAWVPAASLELTPAAPRYSPYCEFSPAASLNLTPGVPALEIDLSAPYTTLTLTPVAPIWRANLGVCEWELPELTITASGELGSIAQLELVAPELTAYGGGYASNELVALEVTATATNAGYNTASLELISPELTATGTVPPTASTSVELIAPTLTGHGGGTASLELVAPELTCTGTTIQIATAALELVSLSLEATGHTGAVATVSLELAALELIAAGTTGDVGTVALTLPALTLLATGEEAVTETTYAVNLNTGAVTQLLLGAFSKLVTAHGRLYGLRSDGSLVYLGGTTDEGAAIPAEIRLAPQMFGTNHPKRMSAVYLSSREDDGLYLDVVADEVAEWRYETPTDTAPAFGTHRVKTGRGIKFHTAGLRIKNRTGGRLDIGGIEALIDVLSPRPLS